MVDIAVIGGGASGIFAAICAAKQLPDGKIVILEKNDRIGKKLLATGNGRCNLTNLFAKERGYNQTGASLANQVIGKYSPKETMRFFSTLGVECKIEEEGRCYPRSDQASSVLEMLRLQAHDLGIEERCGFAVQQVSGKKGRFVICAEEQKIEARRVILSTGGCAAPHLGAGESGILLCRDLGLSLTPAFPSLVSIKTDTMRVKALKGMKCQANITLKADGRNIQTQRGELLFTEYGMSGICIFQLSRAVSEWCMVGKIEGKPVKNLLLSVNLFPDEKKEQSDFLLDQRQKILKRLPMETFFTGLINKKIGQAILKETVANPFHRLIGEMHPSELKKLQMKCRDWRFPITGVLGWQQAQVMAGGVKTDEVMDTMESHRIPGLYLCGELLDVDGSCGGFNLQWAWSSGRRAGVCAAKSLQERGGKK